MRTSVQTDPDDDEVTDEWPSSVVAIDPQNGELSIVDVNGNVDAVYTSSEWHAVTTTKG